MLLRETLAERLSRKFSLAHVTAFPSPLLRPPHLPSASPKCWSRGTRVQLASMLRSDLCIAPYVRLCDNATICRIEKIEESCLVIDRECTNEAQYVRKRQGGEQERKGYQEKGEKESCNGRRLCILQSLRLLVCISYIAHAFLYRTTTPSANSSLLDPWLRMESFANAPDNPTLSQLFSVDFQFHIRKT